MEQFPSSKANPSTGQDFGNLFSISLSISGSFSSVDGQNCSQSETFKITKLSDHFINSVAYMFHSVCDISMSLGGQVSVSIVMGKRALDRLSIRSLVDAMHPMEKATMREVAKSQSITLLSKVIFGQRERVKIV